MDVREWLDSLDLGQYAQAFEENDIDWDLIPRLTADELKEIGVKSVGHRKRIMEAVAHLARDAGTPTDGWHEQTSPVITTGTDREAERRQLTVMFCDLVGSTELATRLDPEELSEVIRAFQDKCAGVISRFGGYIARYMGDGLLVYFGFPQAHENEAERAVRAGLDLVEAVSELSSDRGVVGDRELSVRIGIATGNVVVGDIVGEGAAAESAVVGETPNLAARLQGLAKPNQVVLSAATHSLLGERFDCQDLGLHTLKGLAEPVSAWHVLGERGVEPAIYGIGSRASGALVGRQEELGLLLRAWEASKEGHGEVVLINGEPGIGKSRLLQALRESIEGENYLWAPIHCSPYHTKSALYPVIEQLKRAFRWEGGDSAEARLVKLEQTLSGFSLSLEEAIPLYAALLSIPIPAGRYPPLSLTSPQQRQMTLDALSGWLFEEAERRPVLQVWEDVHWADPSTLELLGVYIEQTPTAAMLQVVTFRPEFTPPWPQRSHVIPITLNRLERVEVEQLIINLSGNKPFPSEVVEHIVAKADGVPLYVEELTKSIRESGLVTEQADHYALTGSLAEVEIPATLQDTLMSRLDRLPAVRELAQLGAVLGREFAYEMLRNLVEVDEQVLRDGLHQLVAAELLYQRGRPPRARYIFKHALIQDAAYQSLLKRSRQRFHRQVAELLMARYPDLVAAQPELVAHHCGEAGMISEAIDYWGRAGQHAIARSAYTEAIAHLDMALALLDKLPVNKEQNERELPLQTARAGAVLATKGLTAPETAEAYLKARALCEKLGNPPAVFPVLRGLEAYHYSRAEYDRAYEVAEEFSRLAEAQTESAPRSQAPGHLGGILSKLGKLTTAREYLEKALDLYDPEAFRDSMLPDSKTRALTWLSSTMCLLGYPDQGLALAQEVVRHTEQLGYAYNLAFARTLSNEAFNLRRDHELARVNAEQLVAVAVEHGLPQYASFAKGNLGQALIGLGDFDNGIAQLRESIDANRAVGVAMLQPSLLGCLAAGLAAKGRLKEAADTIDEALTLTERTNERWSEAELHRLKGELLLKQDNPENTNAAEACFLKSLDIAREQGAKWWELRTAISLARLWRDQGKREDAHNLLTPIYDWFTEGFDTADLKEAKALVEEVS